MLADVRQARAVARDRAWLARGELTGRELPGSRAAGRVLDQIVIDFDATLVTAHSDKEGARGKSTDDGNQRGSRLSRRGQQPVRVGGRGRGK